MHIVHARHGQYDYLMKADPVTKLMPANRLEDGPNKGRASNDLADSSEPEDVSAERTPVESSSRQVEGQR